MRTLGLRAGVTALALVMAPVPVRADTEIPRPETRCTIGDPALAELSGLAVDDHGVYAVNDGGTRVEVVVLGNDCETRDVLTAPTDPYDVEDLALGPDGTLWLGDTGDNLRRRETVALHALARDGTSQLYRLTYPDGAQDAEALIMAGDGTPYIVTKNVLGNAGVYRPAAPLREPGPTPLERVGTVPLTPTDTQGGPAGVVGTVTVTGAALSADGGVVALRTYTDAYLYPVVGHDIAEALRQEPVRVPLPDEPQGEAIAFTGDGALLTAGEGVDEPLRVVPAAAGLVARHEDDTGGDAAAPNPPEEPEDDGFGVLPGLAVAAVVVVVVITGIRRRRR
ncbi:hypothetical protein [Saccharomonospora piscinae]|uniref:hypothetical protein n=1 Tax=Saccharomonospora piscinae TaxID=687388 RepID=UPI001ABE99B5